ncbi:MAG: hypothetical protein ABL907_12475 [Hyphomicrobium sp.]
MLKSRAHYVALSYQTVEVNMHELMHLIGLIVVVMFILGALGLR